MPSSPPTRTRNATSIFTSRNWRALPRMTPTDASPVTLFTRSTLITPDPKSRSETRLTTLSMRSRTFGRTSRSSQVPAAFHALPAESLRFRFSSDGVVGSLTCCTFESGSFVSRCLYQVRGSSSSSSDDSTFAGVVFFGGFGFVGGSFFFASLGGQHTRLWKRQSSRWQRAPQ